MRQKLGHSLGRDRRRVRRFSFEGDRPSAFKSFLDAAVSRKNLNLDGQFDQPFLFVVVKGKINMKLQNLIHILIGIVCIGLLPNAQAVVPAPDGSYSEGNTAEGQNAL
jgi:hypothetical protein